MFVGHFGLALGAKRLAPRTSLGVLFAASQLVDLVWPVFLLLGVERVRVAPGATAFTPLDFAHYPWTHSLAAAVVWSLLAGIVYGAARRDRGGAVVVGLLVASHWVLDWITHRPDLPLWPGGPRTGLGLWDTVPGTLLVESLIFLGGVWSYSRATRALDATGRRAWWSLVAALVVIYAANAFSPPPPSAAAVAWTALAAWLFPLWAHLADRHRAFVGPPSAAPEEEGEPLGA